MEVPEFVQYEQVVAVVKTEFPGYVRKEIKMCDDPDGVQIKVIIPTKEPKGFTLIELTVTMLILGFVLLAMGSHIGVVMKTTVKDRQITAATHLLQDKIEGLKNSAYTSVSTGSDSASAIGATFNRNWTVTPVSNNMQQVRVVVSWQGGTLSGSTICSQ